MGRLGVEDDDFEKKVLTKTRLGNTSYIFSTLPAYPVSAGNMSDYIERLKKDSEEALKIGDKDKKDKTHSKKIISVNLIFK